MTSAAVSRPLKVGLYIDAFNVYYGARDICGRGVPGWRWLDLPALVEKLMTAPHRWPQATLARIAYCTADRDVEGDSTSLADQQTYIGALEARYPNLIVERGLYVAREKTGDLMTPRLPSGHRVRVEHNGEPIPPWLPLRVVPGPGGASALRATITTFEEKGSDVNVASHLLMDALSGHVEAAVVVSNDSDLKLPVQQARARVAVGTVNPGQSYTSRALRGQPTDGASGHWWARLDRAQYFASQLPNPAGSYAKPARW